MWDLLVSHLCPFPSRPQNRHWSLLGNLYILSSWVTSLHKQCGWPHALLAALPIQKIVAVFCCLSRLPLIPADMQQLSILTYTYILSQLICTLSSEFPSFSWSVQDTSTHTQLICIVGEGRWCNSNRSPGCLGHLLMQLVPSGSVQLCSWLFHFYSYSGLLLGLSELMNKLGRSDTI